MRGRVIDIGLTPLIRVRIVEAFIILGIAQHGEEFLQRAFKADFLLDGFHFFVDARHFGEANLVDFVGRQVRRGLRGQQMVVVGLAIWLSVGANRAVRVRRVGHVFFGKGDNGFIGRLEIVDQRDAGLLQLGVGLFLGQLAGFGKLGDFGFHVSIERAVFAFGERGAGDDLLRLVDHAFIGKFRRMDAAGGRLLRYDNGLVHGPAGLADPGDQGVEVCNGTHVVEIDQERGHEALRPVHLVEDVAIIEIVFSGDFLLGLVLPDVIGNPVGRGERLIVELAFHLFGRCHAPGQLFLMALDGEAVDLVILVLAAKEGQANRAELQLFFIFCVEPGVEALAIGCHLLGGDSRLFRRGSGRGLATGGQRERKGNRGGGLLDHEEAPKGISRITIRCRIPWRGAVSIGKSPYRR